MQFINLIAGIVLILLGLRLLRKGFARLFGGDLIDWLQDFTRTRPRSLIGGTAAGTIMPSSTAMALLSVDMTRDGKMPWPNVLAVLLGAQLGITVLIQVLSFNLQDYAGAFLAVGGVLFLFVERSQPKGIGQALLAFALMLLGMGFISDAARSVGSDPAIENLFAALADLPLLFLFGALVLTLLVQSSTASIALALGLAAGGQMDLHMLLLWVIGANLGLCLTVLVAGWGRLDGRRLGLAVLIVKLPLAALVIALLLALPRELWTDLPGSLQQQAAWTHTLFNLLACAAVLVADKLERLALLLVPEPPAQKSGKKERLRLDPLLLQSPALAVNAAMRETLRIFDTLHVMRDVLIDSVRRGQLSPDVRGEIEERTRQVLSARRELVRFLDAVPDDSLDVEDGTLKETIDDFMRELPIIVRTLGRELLAETDELLKRYPQQLEQVRPLLIEAAQRLSRQMENVARMLMQEKPEMGSVILQNKRDNSAWLIRTKRSHGDLPHPAWEILDDFQQLNRRLSGVAYVYCRDEPGADEL